MAHSVHAAPWTDCHAVFRTSDCRSVHFRNVYWSHHLAPADEALCAPEHSGHIFPRRSTPSRSSLIFAQRYLPGLTARTDGKQNYELAFAGCWRRKARVRNLSSAILPDSSRRGIHMTSDHRPERRIML